MGNRHLYLQPADAETRLDRDLWHRIATSNAPAGLKALAATVGAAGSDERVPVTVPLALVDEFRQWHTRLANRRGREEQAIWDAMGRPAEPQRCMNAGNTPAYVRRYHAGQSIAKRASMYGSRTEYEMGHERPYVTDPAAARFCEALLALIDAQQALDAERIDLADRAGMVATMGDNGADTIDLIRRLLRRTLGRDDDDRRGERGPRPDRMARELRITQGDDERMVWLVYDGHGNRAWDGDYDGFAVAWARAEAGEPVEEPRFLDEAFGWRDGDDAWTAGLLAALNDIWDEQTDRAVDAAEARAYR